MFPRVTKLSDFTSANALPFQDVNPVSKWFLNLVGLEQAGDPVMGCSTADYRKWEPLTSDDRYGKAESSNFSKI